MDIRDLVNAVAAHEALAARAWVLAANRAHLEWARIPKPHDLSKRDLVIAAGLVEMLAERAGVSPPPWTADIAEAPEPIFLVRSALTMPRLRKLCEEHGPEPLRRRGIMAPPDYLTAA